MTSAALDAGLIATVQSEVWLVKIVWPNGTMRLMTSPGELVWQTETYVGADPAGWGVILDTESIGDGAGGQAPTCRVSLALTDTLRTACLHPTFQGARVDIWRGLRRLDGPGLIDAEPLMIAGQVSSATLQLGGSAQVAEILVVSSSERRFLPTGGVNLDTTFDGRIDPADRFNQFGAGTAAVSPASGMGTNLPPGFGAGGTDILPTFPGGGVPPGMDVRVI